MSDGPPKSAEFRPDLVPSIMLYFLFMLAFVCGMVYLGFAGGRCASEYHEAGLLPPRATALFVSTSRLFCTWWYVLISVAGLGGLGLLFVLRRRAWILFLVGFLSVLVVVLVGISVLALPAKKTSAALTPGRGLHVGPRYIVNAGQRADGSLTYSMLKSAIVALPDNAQLREKLDSAGGAYHPYRSRLYVLGEPALEFGASLGKIPCYPLERGRLPDPNDIPELAVQKMISLTLGTSARVNEACAFTVMAPSVDLPPPAPEESRRDYVAGILRRLGYEPMPFTRGQAIIYSELADDDFSGIAISCEADGLDVCMTWKTVPVMDLSTARGGDWVLSRAAQDLKMTPVKASAVRSKLFDLAKPEGKAEETTTARWRAAMAHALAAAAKKIKASGTIGDNTKGLEVVCAGRACTQKGFVKVLTEEVAKANLPVKVKQVRSALEPVNAAAQGCLLLVKSSAGM